MTAQLLLVQCCTSEREGIVTVVFAVLIGFMFGFVVAEVAQRYFDIDLPSFF